MLLLYTRITVSYTHLDVYKRQILHFSRLAQRMRKCQGRALTQSLDCSSSRNYANYVGMSPGIWKIILEFLRDLYKQQRPA